jgi:DNA repair protein RadA/Sms
MVDCVLYFEGESSTRYRIIRSAKNRFGSTNEIGVFEMEDKGLREVANPSETLLSGRPVNVPGTCVACVMEGTRPVLAEIQALVSKSGYAAPPPRGGRFDFNRSLLLLAVFREAGGGGLKSRGCDTYINVIGGLKLDEPAADLPAVIRVGVKFEETRAGLTAAGGGWGGWGLLENCVA